MPERARPSRALMAANAAVAAALVVLTVATAADRRFALWFCAAALATLALFRLAGAAVVLASRAGASAHPPFALVWPTCTGRVRPRL